MRKVIIFISMLLLANCAQAATQYVDIHPLAETVKTPVGSIANKASYLPIITWGGDIATIYGNGNQHSTASGSIFAQYGLDYKLKRVDAFKEQLQDYLSGKTPYLRGTLGMINSASDLLSKSANTKPIVFYQLTWSTGGDALVVKPGIASTKDLKGKTIALQAYGPHVDYLSQLLSDAGLSSSDIKIKWLPDLTGTDNSPMAALHESNIDAAFVIIPDALALTSGGNTGTGSEDSVRGAKILLSTKTANRVIADVYAVRSDYYQSHTDEIKSLTNALIKSEEALAQLVKDRNAQASAYNKTMQIAAELLLDSPEAIADAEGLYADCEFVGFNGNVDFFANDKYPRNFARLNKDIKTSLKQFGLISGRETLAMSNMDYKLLETSQSRSPTTQRSHFNQDKVASVITRKQQKNTLDDGELFSFDVYFKPNQQTFTESLYLDDFKRVTELAATYGGAIISVEGHSDPMGYLRAKKNNQPSVVLGRIKQSARNLSLNRAQSVRDAIIAYAKKQSVAMDPSQYATVGHGIAQPSTGTCGSDPCTPKSKDEWLSNMRVKFRIIQIEAESDVFMPL